MLQNKNQKVKQLYRYLEVSTPDLVQKTTAGALNWKGVILAMSTNLETACQLKALSFAERPRQRLSSHQNAVSLQFHFL